MNCFFITSKHEKTKFVVTMDGLPDELRSTYDKTTPAQKPRSSKASSRQDDKQAKRGGAGAEGMDTSEDGVLVDPDFGEARPEEVGVWLYGLLLWSMGGFVGYQLVRSGTPSAAMFGNLALLAIEAGRASPPGRL